ncbi:MAG: Crp/Fnr family transcriptional regulator [Anaerolineales bacterium]|nr:Crp/Fnr family transcriptional regulator [Anaerolineales bacterium]MCB8953788.1 Crp/Fnr family transcriptional regulator [Ardenticatenales bacterium]
MFDNSDSAIEALKTVPFFSSLRREEANALVARMIPRRFAPDQIIFHLGDPGGLLYILTQGKVKISRATPEGQEALLAILGPGDFFGELALLDDSPRSATAEAIEQTETMTLHRDEFLGFLDNNPAFTHHVLRTLAIRIRHLNSQISDIFFLDLPARLARILLNLADNHGQPAKQGTLIDISLTQTDMAEMTGATRVSINKALSRFRRSGWIITSGRHVTIVRRDKLEELIQMSGG